MRTTIWISLTTFMTLLLFVTVSQTGTDAWFVHETKATGKITNATAEDLINVTVEEVSCDHNDPLHQVTLKNTSDVTIPVKTKFYSGDMKPDESVTSEVAAEKSNTIDIHVTGFRHFIDDVFHIDVTQKCD